MGFIEDTENKLNEVFVKNAPFELPKGLKQWLVDYAWIFALIGTILGAIAIFGLLGLLGVVSVAATAAGVGGYVLFAWLALIGLIVQVVLTGMAISPLKAKQKRGWNLIFTAELIAVAYSVFNWMGNGNLGSNMFGLIWSLIWVVIGFYILFQVRSGFTHK